MIPLGLYTLDLGCQINFGDSNDCSANPLFQGTYQPTHFSKVHIKNIKIVKLKSTFPSQLGLICKLGDSDAINSGHLKKQKISKQFIFEAVDPSVIELPIYKALAKLYDNYNNVGLNNLCVLIKIAQKLDHALVMCRIRAW